MKKLFENQVFSLFVVGLAVAYFTPTAYGSGENVTSNSTWVATEIVQEQCRQTNNLFPYDYTMTCCQKKVYKNAVELFKGDPEREQCLSSMKEADITDIPTALNRRYLCLLKAGGATAKDFATAQSYFTFITQNYNDSIKSAIMRSVKGCAAADKEKDEFKRFQRINYCLLDAEMKACYAPKDQTKANDIAQGKCKGKRTKLPVYDDLYFNQDMINRFGTFHSCILPFKVALQDFPSKNFKTQTLCKIPCYIRGEHFKSRADLKLDINSIKKDIFPAYSKKTRDELLKIWTKMSSDKYFRLLDNTTGTVKDAVKWMQGVDEPTHIKAYCGIFTVLAKMMVEMTIELYCRQDKMHKVLAPFQINGFL